MTNSLDKRFIAEKGIMIIPVAKPAIPERIRNVALENDLIEKEETHISVVVTKNARIVLGKITESDEPEEIKKQILLLFNSFAWEYSLTDEYFLQENFYTKDELRKNGYTDLTQHTRRSIVQLVDVPDMKSFYKELDDLLNTTLQIPKPHITLFSWSDYEPMMQRGIGISSKEEFDRYTKKKFS